MEPSDDFAIVVTAAWSEWRSAYVRLADLHHVHWYQPAGAPQILIHAYVSCADILGGTLTHRCDAASAPHHVRVCVLRSHNIPAAYEVLMHKAVTAAGTSAYRVAPIAADRVRHGRRDPLPQPTVHPSAGGIVPIAPARW